MSKEKALNSVLLSIVCVILVGLSYAIFKNPIQKIFFFVVVIASVISVIYYIVGSKKGKFN